MTISPKDKVLDKISTGDRKGDRVGRRNSAPKRRRERRRVSQGSLSGDYGSTKTAPTSQGRVPRRRLCLEWPRERSKIRERRRRTDRASSRPSRSLYKSRSDSGRPFAARFHTRANGTTGSTAGAKVTRETPAVDERVRSVWTSSIWYGNFPQASRCSI